MLKTTELHQAFFWVCDHCGHDNFERAVTVDPKSKLGCGMLREIKKQRFSGNGTMVIAPGNVICNHCGGQFETAEH